jgi:hypothetical protein
MLLHQIHTNNAPTKEIHTKFAPTNDSAPNLHQQHQIHTNDIKFTPKSQIHTKNNIFTPTKNTLADLHQLHQEASRYRFTKNFEQRTHIRKQ